MKFTKEQREEILIGLVARNFVSVISYHFMSYDKLTKAQFWKYLSQVNRKMKFKQEKKEK
jgi:hypothetical protein